MELGFRFRGLGGFVGLRFPLGVLEGPLRVMQGSRVFGPGSALRLLQGPVEEKGCDDAVLSRVWGLRP